MLNQLSKFDSLKKQVIQHKWLLIVPTVGCTVLALMYAFLSAPKWSATQAIVVREELSGRSMIPGRFDSLDAMKTVQETIQETCKSPAVLREAMKRVGPRNGKSDASWPSVKDIEGLQQLISISAPNGAEFGQTEILHVTVKDKSPDRAVELARAVCEVMNAHFNELRTAKAGSMEKEMYLSTMLNQQEVDEITKKLAKLEQSVGVDLADLRSLSNPGGGSSNLQSQLSNARNELRGANQELTSLQKQSDVLKQAQVDPDKIIATPNELLVAQPSLKTLKDGLINAQLAKATVMGTFTEVHPRAKAAALAVKNVQQQIEHELVAVQAGLKSQIEVSQSRNDHLHQYVAELEARLANLSRVRADYENLANDLDRARRDLATAKTGLIEARAARSSTESSSQIVLVDEPLVGSRPAGLGKRNIASIGLICGLAIGVGLFLFVTSPSFQGSQTKGLVDALLAKTSDDRTAAEADEDLVDGQMATDVEPEMNGQAAAANVVMGSEEIESLINQLKEYEDLIEAKLSNC